MRKIFKKVSAIAASALMVGLTMGTAVAANYPNPFVVSGVADVAIVYGTGSGVSTLDLVQAGNIQSNLQSYMTGSTGGDTSISGEAAGLFGSGSSQLYVNNTLNSVKSGGLSKSNLPTILADQTFSGNVDATITQTITMGSLPVLQFAKQPTSEDDPDFGWSFSTTSGKYLYNASASFSKAVNFTSADSEGEDINLFGTTWTVSSSTDTTDLVLLKSAEKISLSSDAPTASVTIEGKVYTVELISASDTAATVAITDSAGTTETKEINEAASKTVNGITVAITTADETNLKLSATIVAGSNKITLTDDTAVTVGEAGTVIDGTKVDLLGGTTACTKLTVSVFAPESDKDAILPGEIFMDPVFGTFKVDFSGLNIADDSTSREDIKIANSGDDKMQITMTDYRGYTKSFQYVYNGSAMALQWDTNGRNIVVKERSPVNYSDYVVLGNEDDGRLVKLTTITNYSATTTTDAIVFTDVFSGETYTATGSTEGSKTVTIGGNDYTVVYNFASEIASEARTVFIQSPDSTAVGDMIIYPTISTAKGAKVMFYKPLTINISQWDAATDDGRGATGATGSATGNQLENIKIPNGANSYQTIAVDPVGENLTVNSIELYNEKNFTVVNMTSIGLSFNFSRVGGDNSNATLRIHLQDEDRNGNIANPAVVVIEEKDDGNSYETFIITTEEGSSADDGIGVSDVLRSWSKDATWNAISLYSDSKKTKEADRWGTIALIDSADSDQKTATISYPDDQLYALTYIAEEAAAITTSGASGTTSLGEVLVTDSEVSSVSTKNLIVVGGSCINSAAATILGSTCGSSFTDKTGIGSGQFLIQSLTSPYSASQIALVVAGYEAADTVNAATYLRTKIVDTTVGKKYKGTSATSAELVTTTA
ncbi:MAG: hypothetical protein PHX80_00260 [Candidatus Nanoarchaeia archaeon]|nr:hypothetical protein [Candidatus Nanoarchaeia archaeon]MDD5588491.1 hypothetical protein [Candidatus Nanoarchaeia archaeon]